MKILFRVLLSTIFLASNVVIANEVLVLGNQSMPLSGAIKTMHKGKMTTKNSGMIYEILEEATHHGAPTFKWKLGLPWKRAQLMIRDAGETPIAIIPFARLPEREKTYTWIAKLFPYKIRLSTYNRATPISIEEAKSETIGVIRATAHISLLHSFGLNNLYEVDTAVQNAKMLKMGRLKVIAESEYVDIYNWKILGYPSQGLQHRDLEGGGYVYIAGNLHFPQDIADKIKMALDTMRKNGKLEEILKRWRSLE
ncbi:transporter substrate-binding domain-containing protein [bacterium AH-315-K03]|nr:transporter substrate-binding domain-containing protein [bacterium AH-315-K03]